MTPHTHTPPILLIPGHWLGAWAWDEVRDALADAGHDVVALTLPGLDPEDPGRAGRTLDDQVSAIDQALDRAGAAANSPAVLVAHSGANAPVSLVLDRRPEAIARIVWVDSGPAASGTVFAPDAPADLIESPLPPFEELGAQASLAGLSPEALARFRERAVPEPGPVLRGAVELSNAARLDVPTTIVCCSLPGAQMMALAEGGHPMFAEVARLSDLELVDLPTGHWPMWSEPRELAAVIGRAAEAR